MASPVSAALRHPLNAQVSSDEDALAYSDQPAPLPQLTAITNWRTASSGEELWSEFEVRRRSAEYYLKLYFECMDAISADASTDDYDTIDQPTSDATLHPPHYPPEGPSSDNMMQLKIYQDTILRELIVMEKIALYVQQAYVSIDHPAITPKKAMWTIGCCLAANLSTSAAIVAVSALGAVAGGAAIVVPPSWRAYHTRELEGIVASLRDLKKTVADGLDPAPHRHSLDASRFTSLERVAEGIQGESGRVIEEEP